MFRFILAAVAVLAAATAVPAQTIETIAGTSKVAENSPARDAVFKQAEGLAAAPDGTIYVSDAAGHRVRRISPGGVITTVAGTGDAGLSGDNGPADRAALDSPYGVAIASDGSLYLADLGNGRIRRVAPNGVIRTVAGGGNASPKDGLLATEVKLLAPRNLTLSPNGTLFFSDFTAHAVYRLENDRIYRVAGSGLPGNSGDGSYAVDALLSYPAGLAFDSTGTLYIADSGNRRIRRVITGKIWPLAISTAAGFTLDLPNALTALTIDPSNTIYAANRSGEPIVQLDRTGRATTLTITATEVASCGTACLLTIDSNHVTRVTGAFSTSVAGSAEAIPLGDNGPADAATLNGPYALAAGGDLIYIADLGQHRVRAIDRSGRITSIAGGNASLSEPAGLAVDSTGRLYIADRANHRILLRTLDGSTRIIAGTGTAGLNNESLAARAQLNAPHALALDEQGNLFIADTGNNLVRVITPFGMISTFAGGGNNESLAPMNAFDLALKEPRGLAFDKSGNLWISEMASGRLRCVSPTGRVTTPFTMQFAGPRSLAFLPDGRLLLAETQANQISIITPDGIYGIYAGTGIKGFTGDGQRAANATLSSPMDVLALPDGSVLIADYGNNRVRRVRSADLASPSAFVITHAATGQRSQVAAGQLVTLWGSNLPASPSVSVDGQAGGVIFASATQINFRLPDALTPGPHTVMVLIENAVVGSAYIDVAATAPGLFTIDGSQAAALLTDNTPNSPVNAVRHGDIIVLFGTGLGNAQTIGVTIQSMPATVLYAGSAPGLPGVFQINARVPTGFLPSGNLNLIVTADGIASPAVQIAVR